MKRSFKILTMLFALLMILPISAFAQMQVPQLGVDSEVRIGKLPNGLTYYIRHNEYPKGQADFYIAQKVGSILEEDNQRGLAHFLEHMCFNGTTHFPGKDLINWCESVGIKFGANLNAYTSIDQTVYNISNVPVAREGVQDSCLLILHDWANDLLLEPEEIDAERGVIHQEWRRSMVGQMRILENLLPVIYPNSKYGHRLPIGTMEVVDNFPYQALRDYYEKWYRPDQQGIIVVGDIDVDRIEGKIKEMFADIEMPENAAERVYLPVEDNEGTIYAIGHDKEQNNSVAELMFKTEAFPDSLKNTMIYYMQSYVKSMVASMLNTRLNDISSKPDAPFAGAGVNFGEFFVAKTKEATTLSAVAKTTEELPQALAAAYRELLRAVRGGFTTSEYERAKSEYLSRMEKQYNNRNKRENGTFVNEYVNNFIDGEPIPSIEEEYQLVQLIANNLPVQQINMMLPEIVTPNNRVLMALMPDNESGVYPTEEQFAAALAAVDGETIEAFVDEVKSEPLIAKMPKPGKIVKETMLPQWDATEWVLSNGAKVYVKPTNFKDDEILVSAVAVNGNAFVDDKYANSLIFMPVALRASGLGTYTNSDLDKYLAGKQAGVSPSFGEYTRTISGSTTPKDLPTLMELLYMNFTDINFSVEEFEAMQNTYASLLHNQESNPQYVFSVDVYDSLYSSPKKKTLSVESVKGASREEIVKLAKDMTSNAAEYAFVFVGNVDKETLRPLVEQYIASLPGNAKKARKDVKINHALDSKTGKGIDTYTMPMQTPQTYVFIVMGGDMPFNPKNQKLASIAGQILSKRLLDEVREKEGAVYSIGASGMVARIGNQNTTILSQFPMKPELKDKVLGIIEAQIADMNDNIKDEELSKVKEYLVKSYTEAKEKNGAWLNAIAGWSQNGVDTFNGNIEDLNAITVDDVKNFMKDLSSQGTYRVVILDPETAE